MAIGLLFGWCKTLSGRITVLEKQMTMAKAELRAESLKETPEPGVKPEPEPEYEPEVAITAQSLAPPESDQGFTAGRAKGGNEFDRWLAAVRDFFARVNVVVRAGLIVLFFGVAFLLKYAAEHDLLPVELRLAGVAFAGLAMLALGWRLRDRKFAYALLIQGGGVGILYLTIFAAARLYELLPLGLAFFLMVAVVGLSVLLALLQESPAMAAFGAIGGFLAPVLISSGIGSHVMLFSYYAILNAGILGVAWFKSWRVLNWIGFMFTFVIGMTWGYRFYQPEFFHTTEPFLILFFLFYLAISILFAHRQPIQLKGYIDGSLVFGLPAVVFGLQSALVCGYEYGMAISALAMGGLYIALAAVLWRWQKEGMRLLTESFLSLGVVFASIAIPLGLDSNWTTALWCLEGAGLVWIGVRQRRVLARTAGLFLQLGAGAAFLSGWKVSAESLPILNSVYMSAFLLSLSGFISNYCHQRYSDHLKYREMPIHIPVLAWALFWWFAGGFHEIHFYLGGTDLVFAGVVFIAASGWAFGWLSQRLQWDDAAYPAMAAIPVVGIIALIWFADQPGHPFAGWGAAAWGLAVLSGYHLLYRFDQKWPDKLLRSLHLILLMLVFFLLTREAGWVTGWLINGAGAWSFAAWAVFPALAVVFLLRYGCRLTWPVVRFRSIYLGHGLIPVGLFLLGWIITACFRVADPGPLAYLPLVNPVEITQVFAFWTLIRWWKEVDQRQIEIMAELPEHSMVWVMLATAFLWLNSVIARTVHFWALVDFSAPALFASVYFQSAVSIVWTLTSLLLMAAAGRQGKRPLWVIGAVLLGLVLAKLFLVDLAGIGTVARIISFIGVGVLMLVIGYFSPLPPKQIEDAG
ncbi:MAG: DUF2339 domain-containing protein [Desulfobacteraceae bacterium]|nr:DUF2339 domain-containing protein [Desulfobacteraceae bacterium]